MRDVTIRELQPKDKEAFLDAMKRSRSLHAPWVHVPLTADEFEAFYERSQQNQICFVVLHANQIAGVFTISEIVRGFFQNAYLGFYAVADFAGRGCMSAGLRLVLDKAFNEIKIHRLEANIQPQNKRSLQLVKKYGFRYEGYSPRYLKLKGQWRGHEHWAITQEDFIRDDKDVIAKDQIELVTYDPSWPVEATKEINKLRACLPKTCIVDIQHVGSTAIPGLSAKPIIDIQIAVTSLADMKMFAVPLLQKLDYEYWADNPDPERMFFVKGMPPYGDKRTHHVHMVEPSSKHWRGKLAFRDYLLNHPEVAKEYEQLKIKLAKEHTDDREKYTDAKGEFVNSILRLSEAG